MKKLKTLIQWDVAHQWNSMSLTPYLVRVKILGYGNYVRMARRRRKNCQNRVFFIVLGLQSDVTSEKSAKTMSVPPATYM